MPTTQPRYVLTDTGELRHILDVAGNQWPGRPRRELLDLLLTEAGREIERRQRREYRQKFLAELPSLIDVDVLLSDEAWR